jgi:hypothetical protein
VRFINRLAISSRTIITIIRFGRLPMVRVLGRGEGRLAPLTTRNGDRRLTLLSGGRLRAIVDCVRRVSLDATRSEVKGPRRNSDGPAHEIETYKLKRAVTIWPPPTHQSVLEPWAD